MMKTKLFFTRTNSVRSLWTKKNVNFGEYNLVTPGLVTLKNSVPNSIRKPSYYVSGEPNKSPESIPIKTEGQILRMRESCKLAANILKKVAGLIEIGLTTDEIDKFVHKETLMNGAYPSPLNYNSFPKSICTSVNNVACHGIPDDRALENGDIINVDITVYLNGYHGDCSRTFLVGKVDDQGKSLVDATETCLNGAIKICEPGQQFRNIGAYIEEKAGNLGFNVVPYFIGHGIGSFFHGPPDIYHFANFYPGIMASGMTFTIEPVLTQGGKEVQILKDNWTAVTVDAARTAQFEHTVLITDSGAEIITLPD